MIEWTFSSQIGLQSLTVIEALDDILGKYIKDNRLITVWSDSGRYILK